MQVHACTTLRYSARCSDCFNESPYTLHGCVLFHIHLGYVLSMPYPTATLLTRNWNWTSLFSSAVVNYFGNLLVAPGAAWPLSQSWRDDVELECGVPNTKTLTFCPSETHSIPCTSQSIHMAMAAVALAWCHHGYGKLYLKEADTATLRIVL